MNGIIIPFFKKNFWRYLIGVTFLITVDILQLFIPRLIGNYFDALKAFKENIVFSLPLILVFIALGMVISRFVWRITIVGAARLFEYQTTNKLFSHILKLSSEFFDKWRTGDIMTRFTEDMNALRMLLGASIIMSVDTFLMGAFTVFAMVKFVNPKLTLISIIPLPIITFISLYYGRMIHKRFKDAQASLSDLSSITEESFSGISVIKVFAAEDVFHKHFEEKALNAFKKHMKLIKLWGLFFPLIQLIASFSALLVFYFGGRMVIKGIISLGDLVAMSNYIGMLVWPLMAFGWVINIIQRGRASHQRIMEIFKKKSIIPEPENCEEIEFKGHYEIRNLKFKYPESERYVLNGVNLTIEPSKMIGIVGKIGSGKSTLAKLLVKLYPVDDGMIFVDGKDINQICSKVIRDNVAYVPQDPFLFSMTVKDNIAFSDGNLSMDEITRVAKIARVHEDIVEFPQGYETVVGQRGITVSGGQRQRITIARALAKKFKMIILDDCFSSVDTETEEEIIKNLKEELEGKTIIVITHRLKVLQHADEIIVLDNGKIVEKGVHQELLNKRGIYYSIYLQQNF